MDGADGSPRTQLAASPRAGMNRRKGKDRSLPKVCQVPPASGMTVRKSFLRGKRWEWPWEAWSEGRGQDGAEESTEEEECPNATTGPWTRAQEMSSWELKDRPMPYTWKLRLRALRVPLRLKSWSGQSQVSDPAFWVSDASSLSALPHSLCS